MKRDFSPSAICEVWDIGAFFVTTSAWLLKARIGFSFLFLLLSAAECLDPFLTNFLPFLHRET
jgi:hypothetical protein